MNDYLELPERLYYENFKGDILAFIEAAYRIFKKDFVTSHPNVDGKPIRMKKYPLVNEMEYTFYHITHEGTDEDNRLPVISRMECIPFPRPMVDNINHPYLKVWMNTRKGKDRMLIYHEAEEYLVVLEIRQDYALLWTAYPIERQHTKVKLLKEYEDYKKARTA